MGGLRLRPVPSSPHGQCTNFILFGVALLSSHYKRLTMAVRSGGASGVETPESGLADAINRFAIDSHVVSTPSVTQYSILCATHGCRVFCTANISLWHRKSARNYL